MNNNKIIIYIFIFIIIIVLFYNNIDNNETFNTTFSPTYNLGACSKNCCATQWKIPFDVTENSKINLSDLNNKYYTSNFTCNDGVNNGGCVCLTNESKNYLTGITSKIPLNNGVLNKDNLPNIFSLQK